MNIINGSLLKQHRKESLYNTEKYEKRLSYIVCFQIITLYFTNLSDVMQGIIPIPSSIISNFFKIGLMILFISTIPIIIKRINRLLIFYILFYAIIILSNYLLFYENREYVIREFMLYLKLVLPATISIITLKNHKILFENIIITSRYISIFTAVFFIINIGKTFGSLYYMGFSYAILFPTMVMSYTGINRKIFIDKILVILNIMVVIILGSRGAIACLGIYYIYLFVNNKNNRKIQMIIPNILILTTIIFNLKNMLKFLYELLLSKGIYSRTLRLFLEDEIHIGGRDLIYENLKKQIQYNPLEIRGINADFALNGIYSHNIFLELLYEFGVILGVILIIILISLIIYTIFMKNEDSIEQLIYLYMFSSMPKLLFTSTLWHDTGFWIWIILLIKKMDASGLSKKQYLKLYKLCLGAN